MKTNDFDYGVLYNIDINGMLLSHYDPIVRTAHKILSNFGLLDKTGKYRIELCYMNRVENTIVEQRFDFYNGNQLIGILSLEEEYDFGGFVTCADPCKVIIRKISSMLEFNLYDAYCNSEEDCFCKNIKSIGKDKAEELKTLLCKLVDKSMEL